MSMFHQGKAAEDTPKSWQDLYSEAVLEIDKLNAALATERTTSNALSWKLVGAEDRAAEADKLREQLVAANRSRDKYVDGYEIIKNEWMVARENLENALAALDKHKTISTKRLEEIITLKGEVEKANEALATAEKALGHTKFLTEEVQRLEDELRTSETAWAVWRGPYNRLSAKLKAFEPVCGGPIHVPWDRTAVFKNPKTGQEYKFSMVPDPKHGTTVPFKC